ncbi:MAG: DUF2382 domain-containing protein [Cyanobacteria bacterium CRU_2_1]|nr:DUF2382 domain-containing protein [Cyanobacteria bacterium RU_5_0]NJR58177.1 DUF2382 domain-containing protein [Cyanobacteria bacterium CRU_2_1]
MNANYPESSQIHNVPPEIPSTAIPDTSTDTPLDSTSRTVEEETLRLLEERLIVDRHRRKIGEVIVRKVVETHIVEVPVQREKLIVEQISPERRQLATIDLSKGELTGVVLSPSSNSSSLQSSVQNEFILAATANRVLKEVIEKPEYQTARVKIIFEDATLQSSYQHWLERYSITNPA